MKNYILFLFGIALGITPLYAQNKNVADTTIRFNKKTIQILDSVDQIKVKVFDKNGAGLKTIYEGTFTEGKSYEKWTVNEVLGFDLPFIHKKSTPSKRSNRSYMKGHWNGIGWGFVNVADANNQINDVDGISLKAESSNEFFINFAQRVYPITSFLGITTGLGFDWRNYYFDLNTHLVEQNGVAFMADAPNGINYNYSRLRTCYFTVPLLLEWQPNFGGIRRFFASAGVIGGIKTSSATKIKYTNEYDDAVKRIEFKGLYVNPVMLDFFGQIGFRKLRVYAKYSPYSIFQARKGPNARSVSLGLALSF